MLVNGALGEHHPPANTERSSKVLLRDNDFVTLFDVFAMMCYV